MKVRWLLKGFGEPTPVGEFKEAVGRALAKLRGASVPDPFLRPFSYKGLEVSVDYSAEFDEMEGETVATGLEVWASGECDPGKLEDMAAIAEEIFSAVKEGLGMIATWSEAVQAKLDTPMDPLQLITFRFGGRLVEAHQPANGGMAIVVYGNAREAAAVVPEAMKMVEEVVSLLRSRERQK